MSARRPISGVKSSELSDADQQWWEALSSQVDVPIRDLVDGLDKIQADAIPYARLPTRARSFYSAVFSHWADIAEETITSLVDRPKGGVSTVRAILVAARAAADAARVAPAAQKPDAVAAASKLVSCLSVSDRALLAGRSWRRPPRSHAEVAAQLGVKRYWVGRHHAFALARFQELCADPSHRAVLMYSNRLRRRLGPVVREHSIAAALRELGVAADTEVADLLVYLAGPYVCHGTWLENRSTIGLAGVLAEVDATFVRRPAPSIEEMIRVLSKIGVPADVVIDFVDSLDGVRRFGGQWVKWGTARADKAEAVLHLRRTPASAEEIAVSLGEEELVQSIRQALYEDMRFTRASRRTWALRQWGLPEYSSIFNEIASRIDAAGGAIASKELLKGITEDLPDVAEASVKTYVSNSVAFVTEHGVVRRRSKSEDWPTAAPLRSARGVFRNGRNELRIATAVTGDVLRGSGMAVHPAAAAALDVQPGTERLFTGVSDVVVRWRISSATGPSIGSLRAFAAAVEAAIGDTLVLAFNLRDSVVDAARIRVDDPVDRQLRLLLGRPISKPTAALASSLECSPDEVFNALLQRGDKELADRIDHGLAMTDHC